MRQGSDAPAEPPQLPSEFWGAEAMRAALATWHMGRVIAAYRHHPFHGAPLPQDVVASWVGMGQPQLSRLENGPPSKNFDKLVLWARALRIPPDLLWFRVPQDDDRASGRGEPLDLLADGERPAQMVIAEIESFLTPHAQPGLTEPHRPTATPTWPHVPAAGGAGLLGDALLATLDHYVQIDNLAGPMHLLSVVPKHLELIRDALRRSTNMHQQSQLLFTAARFAELAGWLYQDAGRLGPAKQWSDTALRLAQQVEDPALVSYLWMRKSNIASDAHDPRSALTSARVAVHRAARLSPRLQAVALRQEAHALAMASDSDGCARALDQARRLASEADPDEHDLADYCTLNFVEMEATHCWIELGEPHRAVAPLEEGVATWPPAFRRDLGLGLARLAVAYAGNDQPDDALATARRALGIAADTRSSRTARQLRRVPALLAARGAVDPAEELRHMLTMLS